MTTKSRDKKSFMAHLKKVAILTKTKAFEKMREIFELKKCLQIEKAFKIFQNFAK
jgi:flagellin-specific chaperone FliS